MDLKLYDLLICIIKYHKNIKFEFVFLKFVFLHRGLGADLWPAITLARNNIFTWDQKHMIDIGIFYRNNEKVESENFSWRPPRPRRRTACSDSAEKTVISHSCPVEFILCKLSMKLSYWLNHTTTGIIKTRYLDRYYNTHHVKDAGHCYVTKALSPLCLRL